MVQNEHTPPLEIVNTEFSTSTGTMHPWVQHWELQPRKSSSLYPAFLMPVQRHNSPQAPCHGQAAIASHKPFLPCISHDGRTASTIHPSQQRHGMAQLGRRLSLPGSKPSGKPSCRGLLMATAGISIELEAACLHLALLLALLGPQGRTGRCFRLGRARSACGRSTESCPVCFPQATGQKTCCLRLALLSCPRCLPAPSSGLQSMLCWRHCQLECKASWS